MCSSASAIEAIIQATVVNALATVQGYVLVGATPQGPVGTTLAMFQGSVLGQLPLGPMGSVLVHITEEAKETGPKNGEPE